MLHSGVAEMRSPFLMILCSWSFLGQGSCGPESQQDRGVQMKSEYLGKSLDTKDALKRATAVVLAELIDLGTGDPGAPGQVYYGGGKIRVIKKIKGEVKEVQLTISLTVQRVPKEIAEEMPKEGEVCIFFMTLHPDKTYRVHKILEGTQENERQCRE